MSHGEDPIGCEDVGGHAHGCAAPHPSDGSQRLRRSREEEHQIYREEYSALFHVAPDSPLMVNWLWLSGLWPVQVHHSCSLQEALGVTCKAPSPQTQEIS